MLLLLSLTALLLSPPSLAGEPIERPGSLESVVGSVVSGLLEHQHLAEKPIDDDVSSAWLDAFLDTLDGGHLYFTQVDIDQFEVYRHSLDDAIRRGTGADLEPAFAIWDVYAQRVEERLTHAEALLDVPVDFTIDESWDLDRRDAPFAASVTEAEELWRLYVKEQRLRGALWEQDADERVERLRKRFERNRESVAETEAMDVLEMYLSALAGVHDPHSAYLKPASRDNFDIDLSNSVEGIGAVLRTTDDGAYTMIVELVPGGPADLSEKLHPNDRIIGVAQGDDKPVDIVDFRIDKVVKLIRGKKGTVVRLTVIPHDATTPDETTEISLTRDKVQLEEGQAKATTHSVPTDTGETLQVSVIDVPSFYAPVQGYGGGGRVSADVATILEELASNQTDVVVIDLRRNSGGSLAEAISLTGLFIDKGPVVQVRGRHDKIEVYRDRNGGTVWDGPLVVLTSPWSASASEIFAGAIQDYGRGVIVGSQTTHGKGSVQTVITLGRYINDFFPGLEPGSAGMLKLTTQQFYRVNGASTQARGIEADVVLPSPGDGAHLSEGDLPNALPWNAVSAATVKRSETLTDLIPTLKERSATRVADSEGLQQLIELATRRAEMDAEGGVVSLVLEERQKEQMGDDEDDDPEEDEASTASPQDPVLDEALQVAKDLVKLAG